MNGWHLWNSLAMSSLVHNFKGWNERYLLHPRGNVFGTKHWSTIKYDYFARKCGYPTRIAQHDTTARRQNATP